MCIVNALVVNDNGKRRFLLDVESGKTELEISSIVHLSRRTAGFDFSNKIFKFWDWDIFYVDGIVSCGCQKVGEGWMADKSIQ